MRALPLLAVTALLPLPAAADDIEVDVELVLAVDVSRSMTPHELEIQRRGYAEALVSEPVVRAIERGMLGRIAVMYLEWAGWTSQRVVADWTLIATRGDAEAFAARLTANFDGSMRRTSISGALDAAAASFDGNGYEGLRQVIDVSGDGPNNSGRPVTEARDAALAKGLAINGLPLMTSEGVGLQWHLEDLDLYYRNCVVGGPASFVIPVHDWDEFPAAVRRKLALELAGPPAAGLGGAMASDDYDCLVGEKIWQRMRLDWGQP